MKAFAIKCWSVAKSRPFVALAFAGAGYVVGWFMGVT